MQIGVVLPAAQASGQGATPGWAAVRSFAMAAEDRGLDSVWMFDHFFHETDNGRRAGMHEAWTVVSALAAVTSRIQVGTLVLCSPFRHPGLVAKMAATADEVSGGRLVLGVGAGWHDPELTAFGLPHDHLVSRFAEALPLIAALLRGETVTSSGRYHDFQAAGLIPPPTRRIPLLVAADGPRMLRLTARYADAWNTAWYGVPGDRVRHQLSAMQTALTAEGRDPATLTKTIGIHVYDRDSGVPADPDDEAIGGSVAELARTFDAYQSLGADHLIVQLRSTNERSLDQLVAAAALRS